LLYMRTGDSRRSKGAVGVGLVLLGFGTLCGTCLSIGSSLVYTGCSGAAILLLPSVPMLLLSDDDDPRQPLSCLVLLALPDTIATVQSRFDNWKPLAALDKDSLEITARCLWILRNSVGCPPSKQMTLPGCFLVANLVGQDRDYYSL
jgi:hypothetical protein